MHSSQKVLCSLANLGEPYDCTSESLGTYVMGTPSLGEGTRVPSLVSPARLPGRDDNKTPLVEDLSECPKFVSGESSFLMTCLSTLASGNPPFAFLSQTITQPSPVALFTNTLNVPGTYDGVNVTDLMTASSAVDAFAVNVCRSSCWYQEALRTQLHLMQ